MFYRQIKEILNLAVKIPTKGVCQWLIHKKSIIWLRYYIAENKIATKNVSPTAGSEII
jgi:hypothetical protein